MGYLFQNVDSDGGTTPVRVRNQNTRINGSLLVYGTWDGATVQIQVAPTDSGPWINVTGASYTSNSEDELVTSAPYIRGNVSSAGINTDISATWE